MKVMKQVDAGKLRIEHLRGDVNKMKRLLCFTIEENIYQAFLNKNRVLIGEIINGLFVKDFYDP